jgi:hypothetical protein
MAVHACILMEDHMEIRKVSTVELFEALVQVADYCKLLMGTKFTSLPVILI